MRLPSSRRKQPARKAGPSCGTHVKPIGREGRMKTDIVT